MATRSAVLRNQVESVLGGRVPAPFTFREHRVFETVPSGVPEIDALTAPASSQPETGLSPDGTATGPLFTPTGQSDRIAVSQGGLPRGALTEIVGPNSSGRTSLMISLMAEMTAREEVCALVDASDAFDPQSAGTAGVVLKRVLWVRCTRQNHNVRHALEQALKSTDLLLAGGGFGLVAVDLGDIPPQLARRVPLAHWFRFTRAVEDTPTVLMVLEQVPYAKTCASLVLRLETKRAYWTELRDSGFRKSGCGSHRSFEVSNGDVPRLSRNSRLPVSTDLDFVPHACLLRGIRLDVEVLRSRLQSCGNAMRTSLAMKAH
jgi:recA bacterial DNA recombination protein